MRVVGLQSVSRCSSVGICSNLAARLMCVFVGLGKRFWLHYSTCHWSPYSHHEQLTICQGMCVLSLTHTHTHTHTSATSSLLQISLSFLHINMPLKFCKPSSHVALWSFFLIISTKCWYLRGFESLVNIQKRSGCSLSYPHYLEEEYETTVPKWCQASFIPMCVFFLMF